LEKRDFVDQKQELTFVAVRTFIVKHRDLFRRQGIVVSGWRTYRGHRLGPFFSLRFRTDGRQSAIYLGRSVVFAERIKKLLQEIQREREFARLKREARAEVRECKRLWQTSLAAIGLNLKGFEVRGWNGHKESVIISDANNVSSITGQYRGSKAKPDFAD
jgi:hypothetical protein